MRARKLPVHTAAQSHGPYSTVVPARLANQGTPLSNAGGRIAAAARRLVNKNTSPQAGHVIDGHAQITPHHQVVSTYNKDDDPRGTSVQRATDRLYGLALTPFAGGGGDRFGMKGSPSNSFRGDLGPLQIVEPVAVGAAPRGVRSGMAADKALPGTSVPGGSVTVQDIIGPSPV